MCVCGGGYREGVQKEGYRDREGLWCGDEKVKIRMRFNLTRAFNLC